MNNLLIIALNKTLSLDPDSFNRLKKLDNKILRLTILPVDLNISLKITSAGFENCDHTEATDIAMTGKSSDFIKFSQSSSKNLYQSGIKIVGDMGLAEEIKTILSQLDLDWEGFIAEYTGDVAARTITQVSRNTYAFTKHAQQNFKQDLIEYFQEEIKILPTRAEMENFSTAVKILRDATDRLAAKLQQ
jgi:ubiquinone biosynthesis protein UbiJ